MVDYNSEKSIYKCKSKKMITKINTTSRFCKNLQVELDELICIVCDIKVLNFYLKEDQLGTKVIADLDFETVLRYTEKFSDIVRVRKDIYSKFISLRIEDKSINELKDMKRKNMIKFDCKINTLGDGYISKNSIFFDINYTSSLYMV